jgi:WD40 repeat protein
MFGELGPIVRVEYINADAGGPGALIICTNAIYFWNFASNNLHRVTQPLPGNVIWDRISVDDAAWVPHGPDGTPLVLAWSGNTLALAPIEPGKSRPLVLAFGKDVTRAQFTNLSTMPVIMTTAGNKIYVHSVVGNRPRRIAIMRHEGRVQQAHLIARTSSHPIILSTSQDATVRLWNPFTGTQISRLTFDVPPLWIKALPRQSGASPSFVAAFEDNTIAVFDLQQSLVR